MSEIKVGMRVRTRDGITGVIDEIAPKYRRGTGFRFAEWERGCTIKPDEGGMELWRFLHNVAPYDNDPEDTLP